MGGDQIGEEDVFSDDVVEPEIGFVDGSGNLTAIPDDILIDGASTGGAQDTGLISLLVVAKHA